MTLDDIAPEFRAGVKAVPNMPLSIPPLLWFARFMMTRLLPRRASDETLHIEEQISAVGQRLRIYMPTNRQSDGALLWIHGGGLVIGTVTQDDVFCAETALNLGIPIVSVEYRLAPDSPFPAALDDCSAAWEWLLAHASAHQVNPKRIAVGGESAGGGLAAALAQRLHDLGGIQPCAQWLFYPMLDDRTATKRELDGIQHKIWNNVQNRFGWSSYLGKHFGTDSTPAYAVPARRENLGGLPPAWIGVGAIDLFYEENRVYAERLQAAGVASVLEVVPNVPHGFPTVARDAQISQDFLAAGRAWLAQALSAN